MKRVKNIGRKDAPVVQTAEGVDSARVKPEDFAIQYQVHKREDSHGKSAFQGRGADVNNRLLKGEERNASSGSAPRLLGPRGPVAPAKDVAVLAPEEQ